VFHVAAALVGTSCPRMIDENPSHHAGGDAEEVCPVAPLDMPLIDQPYVCLVEERGRLQRMARRLTDHVARRHPAQVIVDERDQTMESVLPTIAPRHEQLRNLGLLAVAVAHWRPA